MSGKADVVAELQRDVGRSFGELREERYMMNCVEAKRVFAAGVASVRTANELRGGEGGCFRRAWRRRGRRRGVGESNGGAS